ncbi:MAG: HAMP domain-containing histidine kinase [Ruminococcaceae bacterium]|nr:HAMP domain-containing histidine kinase [Oscillospiraceae bacterium]
MVFKKIFTYFVTVLLIVTVILGVVIFYFLGNYVISQKENMLIRAGERISAVSEGIIKREPDKFVSYYEMFSGLSAQNLDSDIILTDAGGKIIVSAGVILKGKSIMIPPNMLATVSEGDNCSQVATIGGEKDSSLIVGVPLKTGKIVIGGIYLITMLPEITKLRSDVIKIYLISGIFVFLLSLILIFILTKRITDPVKAMRKASKELSNGNLQTRVKVYNKDDEIGQLAEQFNNMADSLEKSEYLRKAFVSDVSHELRTPMTTITGFIQGMLDGTVPEEKRKEYLTVVLEESKRLSKLVNDLLDISRLESEEVKLEPSTFDINELIRISIISFENQFDQKKLTVNASFEKEGELVFAEKDSIKRVVTNLLDNAIKFSFENGIIDISTKQKGNKVYVSVKNEGEGISQADQKTIFERFYKLDKSRSQNKNGVGLGLHIVKRIINKHGEKIWINSEEGKYAEFVFTLKK